MDKVDQIALSMLPGLGAIGCRRLMEAFPGADIFALPPAELKLALGKHAQLLDAVMHKRMHARAEQEIKLCERHGVQVLFFTDDEYPQRLNRDETIDCPVVLYVLGTADLNAERTVSIVGTRKATVQGRENTDRLVAGMQPLGATVVSGLAYGIDTAAHCASLQHGLPTVAVLGHGLDRIYPPENRSLAARIVAEGGAMVTEYPMETPISPHNFPARNRIIAALGDATVVVEAARKGGALITATIAAGYQREVFAIPGRLTDTYSAGTNNLIATNKALLLRSADDLALQMGWPRPGVDGREDRQTSLFTTLPAGTQKLASLLQERGEMGLDSLMVESGLTMAKVAAQLFDLEMAGLVQPLPGRMYRWLER